MPSIVESDLYKYLVLAMMLLAILFGYRKGRSAGSADKRLLGWTGVPLVALAITSLGPSALAILIYLGYKIGLLQPDPSGYQFSTFIRDLPLDFAVMNWPFAALYLTGRLWPDVGAARSAMWFSVVAMSLPNVLLFALAPTMVSSVFDAGQGIGVVEAMLILPIVAMIWSAPLSGISDAIVSVVSTLVTPIPIFGLVGWLVGQSIGSAASRV